MKKTISLLMLFVSLYSAGDAQQKTLSEEEEKNMKALAATDTVGWKRGGTLGLNNTQTYLYQWAAGGNSAITVTGLVNYFSNYRRGRIAWDNSLNLAYGILLQDVDSRAIKIDDRLDLTSKYGMQASKNWFYAVLLNFQTQFGPGYNSANGLPDYTNKISDFMSPGRLLISLGMDYKPNDKFTAFLSPITYRGIFVMDQTLADAGAFGVTREVDSEGLAIAGSGENIRHEVGFYSRTEYKTTLMENITFATKLELFSNYLENPQNVDVSWENLIAMKINKYFSFSIATQLIYDDNTHVQKEAAVTDELGIITSPAKTGPGVQFREVAALGINYNF